MTPILVRFLLLGITSLTLCTSLNSQSRLADSFYLEASLGTSLLNIQGSEHLQAPTYSIGFGSKLKAFKKIYFDFSLQYSDLRTKNTIVFVSPYGTVVSKHNLKNLQLHGLIGVQLNKFSLATGVGLYYNLQSKSELARKHDSFVIESKDSFSAFFQESDFQNIGFTLPFEIGYEFAENMELKLQLDLLFIEGVSPLNNRGLRYLYVTNIGVAFRKYL